MVRPLHKLCAPLLLVAASATAQAPSSLPATIGADVESRGPRRGWTLTDIAEVTRITHVAVDGERRWVAFVLKQPSLALDDDLYGLYVINAAPGGTARKLAESPFLSDLEWRPGSERWTVRGDFGSGVQLYEIDDEGKAHPLVVNPELAQVGGADGAVPSCCERPHPTGIVSYGWSPDGSVLWYSRLQPMSPEEVRALWDNGIVWNDSQSHPADFGSDPGARAIELHLFDPATGRDQLITTAPGHRSAAMCAFSRDCGSIGWAGPQRLWFRSVIIEPDGQRTASLRIHDRATGQIEPVRTRSFRDAFDTAVTQDGSLTVREEDGRHRLLELAGDGSVRRDLGEVGYSAIGGGLGGWRTVDGARALYGVRYPDRMGLTAFPASAASAALAVGDNLGPCEFDAALTFGVCVRESLTGAPELVSVAPESGALAVLARPNARYAAIAPHRSERVEWTNRFGTKSDGYVTYPRGFEAGRRYPAILVTHGRDAKNRFAYDGFQWSFPVQFLAERGYVVLSVNEGMADEVAWGAYASGSSSVPVDQMQRAVVHDPIATMEAAVRWAVDRGLVDPDRVGIAGYSRGASITTFALNLSDMFSTGIMADTNFFNAGGFWSGAMVREIYRGLFGGPPWDPRFIEHYRAISPSARAEHFEGSLLQMHTDMVAPYGVELDQMLKEASVPTEMIAYPDETHILHRPRTRVSAMRTSFDWFEFWLNGREVPDPAKADQYARWRELRQKGCESPRLRSRIFCRSD